MTRKKIMNSYQSHHHALKSKREGKMERKEVLTHTDIGSSFINTIVSMGRVAHDDGVNGGNDEIGFPCATHGRRLVHVRPILVSSSS